MAARRLLNLSRNIEPRHASRKICFNHSQRRTSNAKYFALWIMVGSRKKIVLCRLVRAEASEMEAEKKINVFSHFMYENIPYNLFLAYLFARCTALCAEGVSLRGMLPCFISFCGFSLPLPGASSYGKNSSRYAAFRLVLCIRICSPQHCAKIVQK